MNRYTIILALALCTITSFAHSQLIEQPILRNAIENRPLLFPLGRLLEQPLIITSEPIWTGPTSYNELLKILNDTRQLALVVWYTDDCSWCDKYKEEVLSYYMPILQQHYIIYFANANVEKATYLKFAKYANTYFYANGERWNGNTIPVTFLIGPWDKDVVVYGCANGYLDKSKFTDWHNSTVTKWNLQKAPDYFRGQSPPQSIK